MNRHLAPTTSFRPLAFLFAALSTLGLTSCDRRDDFGGYTLWGAIILILDIVAIIDILRQPWSLLKKLIWAAVIIILPVLGLIIYYLFAGRGKS